MTGTPKAALETGLPNGAVALLVVTEPRKVDSREIMARKSTLPIAPDGMAILPSLQRTSGGRSTIK